MGTTGYVSFHPDSAGSFAKRGQKFGKNRLYRKIIALILRRQVFQVHGVDAREKTVLRQQLRRAQLLAYFKYLPLPDRYRSQWRRSLLGKKLHKHTEKLMAPRLEKP
jgi:hypothetical protein